MRPYFQMRAHLRGHFVHCRPTEALTPQTVQEAVRILTRIPDWTPGWTPPPKPMPMPMAKPVRVLPKKKVIFLDIDGVLHPYVDCMRVNTGSNSGKDGGSVTGWVPCNFKAGSDS